MFLPGDIVTLFRQGKVTTGTGIVIDVEGMWALVSWSWVDGRVGRNLLIDLRKVSDNRAKEAQNRV